jgi:hypothetical protein
MIRASWPGLLVAPILALADQSVAYALLEWSCEHQKIAIPNLAHAVFLVLTLATMAMAWGCWRDRPAGKREDSGDAATQNSTLGVMAFLVAGLSALIIVGMWYPHLVLAPCHG